MLRSAQICKKMHYFGQFKGHNSGRKKVNYKKWPHFFHLRFELRLWYSFLYLKMSKFIFMGSPLWYILVCKIPEIWRWKLWDQNFVPFDSGNIHIKESKKAGFTFSRVENQICLISWSSWFTGLFHEATESSRLQRLQKIYNEHFHLKFFDEIGMYQESHFQ